MRYKVPCSELAMHLKIVDKQVSSFTITGQGSVRIRLIDGSAPIVGLVSELLPVEAHVLKPGHYHHHCGYIMHALGVFDEA